MMARTIATEREEKNRLDKAKGIRELLGAKALAAEKPPKGEGKSKNDKTKENPENNAAPVLTKPSPKAHNDKGKGKDRGEKGKGKGKRDKSRGRSQSQDKKSIPRVFYFQKGGCSKGKECLYSHAKKHGPRANSQGPGNVKGGDGPGRGRSPSPKPKSEKPCFLFAKGKCDRADCPYKHDSDAAPAETGSAKAKAAPKGKAKAAAAKAKAAVVVEVKKGHNEDYLPDWSDNDDPSPVAASRFVVKRTKGHVRKDKVVKIKRNPERIMIIVEKDTRGLPKRNSGRTSDPRVVKEELLDSETFKHQSLISHLVARARAQVLNKSTMGTSAPQLAYDSVQAAQMKAEQALREEQEAKVKELQKGESGPPRSFIPEGYIPPNDDQGPKSSSSDVGASAKAHAAKARPRTPRQPPSPPPSSSMQGEKGKSQQQDEGQGWYDKGRSYQSPVHPSKGEKSKGKGRMGVAQMDLDVAIS